MPAVFDSWFLQAENYLVDHLLAAVVITAIGILLIRVLLALITKAIGKAHVEEAAGKLIRAAIKAVLYLLLALIVADRLGINVTGIVALASVLTLAVSLSVQTALTNLISGFTLLYTKPFVSGDFVEIAGRSGTVREIGLTYTCLSTPDNKRISIPNSAVTAAEIINYTVLGTRRVDITVSASYDAPVQTVLDALLEAGNVSTILEDKAPFSAVKSYDDSAICYLLQVWCSSADYWNTQCTVNRRIKEIFDAHGIEMTYPHLNVHLNP